MNNIVTTNLDGLKEKHLPPFEKGKELRLLSLSPIGFGFKNYFDNLVEYTRLRDDIEAVHIKLVQPKWTKMFTGAVPGLRNKKLDQHAYRYGQYWRWILHRWFKGPLPLNRFDVVHIITPECARIIPDINTNSSPIFAVNIDLTVPLRVREFGEYRFPLKLDEKSESRIFKSADLIICRNKFCSKSLAVDYGVSSEKVIIAKNAIALPKVFKKEVLEKGDRKLLNLAFVGNSWKRKRGDMVLKTHQRFFSDNAKLHIFSSDAPVDHSKKNVVWHHEVSRHDLLNIWLPKMDIFALPSRNEGLAWALLEAASVGMPIITTNLPGSAEVVLHQKTGILIKVDDEEQFRKALQNLIFDPDLRVSMGKAAKEFVNTNFDVNLQFSKLFDKLDELVSSRQGTLNKHLNP